MKKIALICDNPLESQPRVLTEVNALKNNFEILLFGEKSKLELSFYPLYYFNNHPTIDFHFGWPVIFRKSASALISVYLFFYRLLKAFIIWSNKKKNIKLLISKKPDLILMHGIHHADWVDIAVDVLKIPLIINMHEYYPLEFEDNIIWMKDVKPLYDRNLRKYGSKANSYFVVCNNIIKKYKEEFNLHNQLLIRNAKPFFKIEPARNSGPIIKMIHHGASISSRKIELTIECMKYLPDNYALDFMLVPDLKYFPKLVELAKPDKRIRFLPIIPTEEIIPFINSYDLGLFLLPPVNFNYLNALPNKLFEFIQARLAIVVSPNPEMKELVEEFQMGAVSKDYTAEEFAKAILSLSKEKINEIKLNTHKAAAIVNDEEEQKKILREVKKLCAA